MNVEPLNKEIYNEALKMGITKITLNFSGGSDQGYLEVGLSNYSNPTDDRFFCDKIEAWAWDTYEFSGAGDGSDYGDDIEYDLVNKKVITSEWFTSRQTTGENENILKLDDEK